MDGRYEGGRPSKLVTVFTDERVGPACRAGPWARDV